MKAWRGRAPALERAAALVLIVLMVSAAVSCASAPGPPLIDPIPSEVAPPKPPADVGPRLIEYQPVSMAEREGHFIELVEDLVIESSDDPLYAFEGARDVVTDGQGRLYVHDSEQFRIAVYEPDGTFSRAYGGAGDMAPLRLGWISLAGEKLAISTGKKITVWTLDGEHLYDRSLLRRALRPGLQGTDDGSLVGSFDMLDRQRNWWYRVEKISLDEDQSLTYGAVPARRRDLSRPLARAGFAATRAGDVYLTRGDEYRVQAFAPDGALLWVLSVDWPREAAEDGGGSAAPALAAGSPRRPPGRGHPVRTDGHGNLYVFPYVGDSWDRDEIPVDVYSPDGERTFAGFVPDRSWLRARNDWVYGIEHDDETDRQRVVRYRLRLPSTQSR